MRYILHSIYYTIMLLPYGPSLFGLFPYPPSKPAWLQNSSSDHLLGMHIASPHSPWIASYFTKNRTLSLEQFNCSVRMWLIKFRYIWQAQNRWVKWLRDLSHKIAFPPPPPHRCTEWTVTNFHLGISKTGKNKPVISKYYFLITDQIYFFKTI